MNSHPLLLQEANLVMTGNNLALKDTHCTVSTDEFQIRMKIIRNSRSNLTAELDQNLFLQRQKIACFKQKYTFF